MEGSSSSRLAPPRSTRRGVFRRASRRDIELARGRLRREIRPLSPTGYGARDDGPRIDRLIFSLPGVDENCSDKLGILSQTDPNDPYRPSTPITPGAARFLRQSRSGGLRVGGSHSSAYRVFMLYASEFLEAGMGIGALAKPPAGPRPPSRVLRPGKSPQPPEKAQNRLGNGKLRSEPAQSRRPAATTKRRAWTAARRALRPNRPPAKASASP